jgi:hypothetical protein
VWVSPIHGSPLEHFLSMRGAIPNDPTTRYRDLQTFVPCDWGGIEKPNVSKLGELKGGTVPCGESCKSNLLE